ncbi:MAG: sensor histidine kinase [Planctomycetota bacterium]
MRIHSLTTRFLLTLLLSTALPFLAFGWYARAEMEERLEQQVVQVFLPQLAQQAADEIKAQLERIEQAVGMLRNALMKVLREGGDSLDVALEVDLTRNFDPDLVLLADGAGRVVGQRLHPRLDRETPASREQLLPQDVADKPWFEALNRGRVAGAWWGKRHLSEFLHRTPNKESYDPEDYSFALAFSVPTRTTQRGVVFALFSWIEVQQVLDQTAQFLRQDAGFASAEVFLCNAQGHYLAHTERANYVRGRLPLELAVQLPIGGDPVEHPYRTAAGEDRRAGFASVDKPPFEWWIGVHARDDELLRTSRDLSNVLLFVTAITAVILVVWSMVASRAILRPVRRLAVATESIARGDLSTRVPARGRHELADLGRAFNRMAGDLDSRTEQLRQAERQAAWAEMARQVAHEIKNPLTPMRMSAQLLARAKREGDPREPELTERLIRTVLEQTDAMARIASDFRHFAGPPARTLEVLDADDILTDAQRHFAGMAEIGNARVEFAPGAAGAQVRVDREELRRVLLNLLHNAIEACRAGDGPRDRVTMVRVTSAPTDAAVVYRVEDDGPGVSGEVQPKLFDPYFTTKSSGTGLGLAICRRILEAHGGHIALETSGPGRTVFRFELPRV